MPYTIEGWIEATIFRGAEQEEEYTWQSVINIGALVDVGDSVSEVLFGLSRRCSTGEFSLQPLAAERGFPTNPSTEVKTAIDIIGHYERSAGGSSCGGFTYASWQEIKSVSIEPEVLRKSDWQTVFNMVQQLEADYRYSDNQIRFVVWFNW